MTNLFSRCGLVSSPTKSAKMTIATKVFSWTAGEKYRFTPGPVMTEVSPRELGLWVISA